MGAGLEQAGDAVAMGIAPVSPDMPAGLRAAVVEGSGQAVMNGVHTAVLVTGVLCLLGAVLSGGRTPGHLPGRTALRGVVGARGGGRRPRGAATG